MGAGDRGQPAERSGADIVAAIDHGLTLRARLANALGAVVVFVFLAFLFPTGLSDEVAEELQIRSAIVLVLYILITFPLGQRLMRRRFFTPMTSWVEAERSATDADRRAVLRYPLNLAWMSGTFWVGAAVIFPLLNADAGLALALTMGAAILLGGITSCSLQYLLAERVLRPVTARALASGAPRDIATPGVATRIRLAWLVATGVPLLGLLAIAATFLVTDDLPARDVIGASLFLGLLALTIGLLALTIAARSVADPLASLRGAVERVQGGDFDARVPVDDGSEVGLLQAGFNRMATGLGERERLREAFGTYVDPHLAERVLSEGTDLAGEEVEVSVLFMDVRGFTTYSERAGAREVVAKLNELYGSVVPIITKHKGHANKFIGDGLLAVFGAPDRLEDHAERAVAAAREIAELTSGKADGLAVGVGVNTGSVMAGTIGGGGRLDFTVIGDTVNTAARVESATRQTGDDVLITEQTLAALGGRQDEWEERAGATLKGKRETVRLFAPKQESRVRT